MDKKTRLILITGSLITFVIVPIITVVILSRLNPQPSTSQQTTTENLPDRSKDDLEKAIVAQQPILVSDGQPIFVIMSVNKSQKGWYIVTIRQKDDTEGANLAKVLLHDSLTQGLTFLLGPGTSFPDNVAQPLGIPGSVSKELNS